MMEPGAEKAEASKSQATHVTAEPLVALKGAGLQFGRRWLWRELSFSLAAGEFLAVLGPNGAGKTTLLKVLLGLQPLSQGEYRVADSRTGYVPQQRAFDLDLPIRGLDLVRFGLDGKRWGIARLRHTQARQLAKVIDEVGATRYATQPLGRLSGGEQQRLRIAQALVTEPHLLLCDEPLLSLDLASQQAVASLINKRRQQGTAVVFVTHEINPILPMVDRVLYLVNGKWTIGTPAEVLTSERLSELYGVHVDVLRIHGRIVVVYVGGSLLTEPDEAGHHLVAGHGEVA